MKKLMAISVLFGSLVLTACSSPTSYDYSAFKESKPRSILVMMPTDMTNEVKAAPAVLAQSVTPLAEAGYYVFPVALVNETFKHNGLTQAQEIQNVKIAKLQEIFNADAGLYLNVKEYGVNYQVFNSVTKVAIEGKLIDLRNGKTLWEGEAEVQDDGGRVSTGNPLVDLLAVAVKQVANQVADNGYNVAGLADAKLLQVGVNKGLLYGPYHPHYGKDPQIK
ncbi:hypothetical protein BKK49_01165 [Rodentibacter rarus]|uniref:DUF799 domain-containing protein n=1 Tax=Rodentibacter rarus TaxID=1908260 RepID=UPI00098472BC|nr:DUF799 domain-containing protein [Rodentibacter rarus]OOF43071.1 hypothetical protein BKK49_01165 [Rodentibacter rarus]